MNEPAQEPPAAPKLMQYVLVVQDQPLHMRELISAVQEFAAPSFLMTNDTGYFWDWSEKGQARALGNVRPVPWKDTPVHVTIDELVSRWAGERAADIWVVSLPASATPRPRKAIQHFLQFVGIQPPEIEYVRSIRKPPPADSRLMVAFPSGEGATSVVLPPAWPSNVFEVSDLFVAWRLRSSAPYDLASNLTETAFWVHADAPAV